MNKWIAIWATLTLLGTPAQSVAIAEPEGEPDLVVIVDTSTTMRNPGMDRKRASLLLTKLLADLVPGRLAAIRLLDLHADAALLPSKETGLREPCAEDPSELCTVVAADGDWGEKARQGLFGVKERGQRGDPAFKRLLDSHLAQESNNSRFDLSFWAAKGVFDRHAAEGFRVSNRTVIWLSDGKDESRGDLPPALDALRSDGVEILSVIFGAGDPSIPERNGLPVDRVSSPADLMRSFAQAFRGILGAPYRIDNPLAGTPEFRMRDRVEEAWVVVYGDKALGEVTVSGPDGDLPADYAADVWPTAGAYRVAHFLDPKPGTWRVRAVGGGPEAAYAVVQRSSLGPVLLEPQSAEVQRRVRLVAGVRAKGSAEVVTDPEVLGGATMRVTVGGVDQILRDDGRDADETAGDGRFSAWHSFQATGTVPLEVRIEGPVVKRSAQAQVDVHEILSWWQRWGWLVLSVLGLLAALFVALGFILPKRFQRTLSLSFAPELDDVDDTPPLAIYTWRGVGIGFYRDARAFLHGDFRISGRARGALAGLFAEAGGARVRPGKGLSLFRQDLGAAWEEVSLEGERVRAGEVYRIGDQGPFFRIALRVGAGT